MEENKAIKISIALALGIFVLFVTVFSINVLQIGDVQFRSTLSTAAMVIFVSVSVAGVAILIRSAATTVGF